MKINILTLFPEFFASPLGCSMMKKAQLNKAVKFNIVDLRDFTKDKHKTTDDRPYGGGPGMVLMIEPVYQALKSLNLKKNTINKSIVLLSAKGRRYNQEQAHLTAQLDELTLICGHYQGVDQRISDHLVDQIIRIGDYVLTGGETAALVLIDSTVRLIKNVLGNPESLNNESFDNLNTFGIPLYTRPENFRGMKVPEILLSGDHEKIEKWRQKNQKKVKD